MDWSDFHDGEEMFYGFAVTERGEVMPSPAGYVMRGTVVSAADRLVRDAETGKVKLAQPWYRCGRTEAEVWAALADEHQSRIDVIAARVAECRRNAGVASQETVTV